MRLKLEILSNFIKDKNRLLK